MERRDFLKYSSLVSLSTLIPVWLLEACKKSKTMDMVAQPIYVTEGDFSTVLNILPIITSSSIILNAKQTSSVIVGGKSSNVFG